MRLRPRTTTLLISLGTAAALSLQVAPAAAHPGGHGPGGEPPTRPCAVGDTVTVPGAERAETTCLDDITTAGLLAADDPLTPRVYTDQGDWLSLHTLGTVNPTGVRGLQVDGYFPDTSSFNGTHGWKHDSQFVLRIPDDWNGGLVVSGAPGNRKQYAQDFLISDFVLERASPTPPPTRATTVRTSTWTGSSPGTLSSSGTSRDAVRRRGEGRAQKERYGHKARPHLHGRHQQRRLPVRWQLENRPELYDGGVDWEGTMFTADGPTSSRPADGGALHPRGGHGSGHARRRVRARLPAAGGLPPDGLLGTDAEGLPRRVRSGVRPGLPGSERRRDGARDPGALPQRCGLRRVVRRRGVWRPCTTPSAVSLTGKIKKPLLTLHERWTRSADRQHRQRRLRRDDRRPAPRPAAPLLPDRGQQPGGQPGGAGPGESSELMPPCFRTAFDALDRRVEDLKPPASATCPGRTGWPLDRPVQDCSLEG